MVAAALAPNGIQFKNKIIAELWSVAVFPFCLIAGLAQAEGEDDQTSFFLAKKRQF